MLFLALFLSGIVFSFLGIRLFYDSEASKSLLLRQVSASLLAGLGIVGLFVPAYLEVTDEEAATVIAFDAKRGRWRSYEVAWCPIRCVNVPAPQNFILDLSHHDWDKKRADKLQLHLKVQDPHQLALAFNFDKLDKVVSGDEFSKLVLVKAPQRLEQDPGAVRCLQQYIPAGAAGDLNNIEAVGCLMRESKVGKFLSASGLTISRGVFASLRIA